MEQVQGLCRELAAGAAVLEDPAFVRRARAVLAEARVHLEGRGVTAWMAEQEAAYACCVAAGAYHREFLAGMAAQAVAAARTAPDGHLASHVRYLWDRVTVLDLAGAAS